jgi:serine/threonine-protein kinase RsbW
MPFPRSPRTTLSELRIPADHEYVVAAKRTAAALASIVGFSVEEIDDLSIAMSQACENAIAASTRQWGPGNGQLRIGFRLGSDGLEVEIRSVAPRSGEVLPERPAPVPAVVEDPEYAGIGMNMIRLFVDELRYQHDIERGTLRMRMVKYLIG